MRGNVVVHSASSDHITAVKSETHPLVDLARIRG